MVIKASINCIPIGVVEGASETFANLMKTVLSKARNRLQSKSARREDALFRYSFYFGSQRMKLAEAQQDQNQDGRREEKGDREEENEGEERDRESYGSYSQCSRWCACL
jgi:hypothetical protein